MVNNGSVCVTKLGLLSGLMVLALFQHNCFAATEDRGEHAQGGFSHLATLGYSSDKTDAGTAGFEWESHDTALSYTYTFKPIISDDKPIAEAIFLQRIPWLSLQYNQGSGNASKYGSTSSRSDHDGKGFGFFYADRGSPFTVTGGLMKSNSDSTSATSTTHSSSDYDSKVITLGYYLGPVSSLSLYYSKSDNDVTTTGSSSYSFSSSSKANGLLLKHYQQLNASQSLVINAGYIRIKLSGSASSETRTAKSKSLGFAYYPVRSSGFTVNYSWLDPGDTDVSDSSITEFGISHFFTDRFGLNILYSKSKDNNPEYGDDKSWYFDLTFRF